MKKLISKELAHADHLDGSAMSKVQQSGDRKIIYVEGAVDRDLPLLDLAAECITIWQSGRFKISVS